MLRLMRKYARHILIFLIIAFVGSIVIFAGTQSFFLGNKVGKSPSQFEMYSEFATLGDTPMNYGKYQQFLNRSLMPFRGQQLDPNLLEYISYNIFQEFVDYSLLLKETDKKKIKASGKEVKQQMDKIMEVNGLKSKDELKQVLAQNGMNYDSFVNDLKDDIKVAKLRKMMLESMVITDKDLDNYFKEVKARHIMFKLPEPADKTNLQQQMEISAQVRKKAEEVLEKAKKGEDFASLAKQYSEGPDAQEGGDLDWVGVNQVTKEIETAAFNLAPGEIAGPIKTVLGYHIIKVEDIRYKEKPKGKTDDELKIDLQKEKQQAVLNDFLTPLRAESELKIYDPALLAVKYKLEGKYDEAIGEYSKIISREATSPIPHMFIGQIYDTKAQYQMALEEYQKGVIKEDITGSKFPFLHYYVAKTYQNMGQRANAITEYSKASEMSGDNVPFRNKLIEVFGELKANKEKAKEEETVKRIKIEQEEQAKARQSVSPNIEQPASSNRK